MTWRLLAAFAIVSIAPLFAARYLPFSDLPEHVATIAAFQHYGDPSFRVAEHFTIAWTESQYSYHRVVSGGTSEPSFATLGHWPLHYRPEAAPPPKSDVFWEFNPCLFRNAEDGPYYDHVLVYGDMDPFADAPPGPAFTVVLREGPWTLYRKVPGARNEPWPIADRGPCIARSS